MNEEKIALIDKICKFHPSLGVENGWSHYTGGMKDDGGWHFRQMLDVPIEEMQEFYDFQIRRQEQFKNAAIKEKEGFEASGMTTHEWTMKQFKDMSNQFNADLKEVFIKTYIEGGTLIKPKEDNNDTSK